MYKLSRDTLVVFNMLCGAVNCDGGGVGGGGGEGKGIRVGFFPVFFRCFFVNFFFLFSIRTRLRVVYIYIYYTAECLIHSNNAPRRCRTYRGTGRGAGEELLYCYAAAGAR